jgi:transmembrane sensor
MDDNLLIKYLLGELGPEEITRVDEWLSANDRNRERYEQFKTVWKITRPSQLPALPDAQAALQRLRRRLQSGEGSQLNSDGKLTRLPAPSETWTFGQISKKWRIAAIFIGLICLGAGIYWIGRHPQKEDLAGSKIQEPRSGVEQAIKKLDSTPRIVGIQKDLTGEKVRADTLPDKSVVTLNKHSSISYIPGFKEKGRRVVLKGEAFFSVTHDPSKPFTVQVNDIQVKVLGTAFNILARPDRTEIVVEKGTIRVSSNQDSLMLHAGEKVEAIEKGGRLKKMINKDNLYGYYLGRPLICDSVPLPRLIEILNEAYGAHIVLGRKELNSLYITTVFPHQPLEKILSVISSTFALSMEIDGQSIVIQ